MYELQNIKITKMKEENLLTGNIIWILFKNYTHIYIHQKYWVVPF